MRLDGTRKELGMELNSDHPRMIDVLHHLYLSAGWADSRHLHSGVVKLFDIFIVEFKAVAVTLLYFVGAVYPLGFGAGADIAGIGSES